jgi:hypothetical protein
MELESVVSDITQVPEPLRPFYVAKDGKHVLVVKGLASASDLAEANGKVVEFRDSNLRILQALGVKSVDEGLARAAAFSGFTPEKVAALKDLDPVAARAALERVAELEKKGVKTGEDVAVQIKAAIDAALGPVQAALANEQKARTEAQGRADKALLRQTVGDKYLKAGGKPSALDFIISEADKAFHVADNVVKAQDNQFSADKPGQPLSIDEWLTRATKSFDFAFEPSKGGGATGGSGGNGNGGGGPMPGTKLIRGTRQEIQRQMAGLQFIDGKGLVDALGVRVQLEYVDA